MLATLRSKIFCLPVYLQTQRSKIIFFNGCETWRLLLREEYSRRVSEKRELRKMLAPKSAKITDYWRKFLKEELHDLYSSDVIRVMKSMRTF